jgi:hypothetical protein
MLGYPVHRLLYVAQGWVFEHVWGVDNSHANFISRVFASCNWMLNPREFAMMKLGRNGHFGKRFVWKVAFILYI